MSLETPETKAFIRALTRLDRSKSTYEKFRDFCEMAYCAYAKLTADSERADKLEARYMQIVETYQDKDTVRAYPELLAMAFQAVTEGQEFLGSVASQLEILDSHNGQFFTPMSVSRTMAEMLLHDASKLIDKQGYITVQEPAAGAGGMVLAAADVLSSQGYDPTLTMLVHAIDISPICYHMCFLQLTFRDIPAVVERANTLSLEHFEYAWTPSAYLFQQEHGHLFPEKGVDIANDNRDDDAPAPPKQLRLF